MFVNTDFIKLLTESIPFSSPVDIFFMASSTDSLLFNSVKKSPNSAVVSRTVAPIDPNPSVTPKRGFNTEEATFPTI